MPLLRLQLRAELINKQANIYLAPKGTSEDFYKKIPTRQACRGELPCGLTSRTRTRLTSRRTKSGLEERLRKYRPQRPRLARAAAPRPLRPARPPHRLRLTSRPRLGPKAARPAARPPPASPLPAGHRGGSAAACTPEGAVRSANTPPPPPEGARRWGCPHRAALPAGQGVAGGKA